MIKEMLFEKIHFHQSLSNQSNLYNMLNNIEYYYGTLTSFLKKKIFMAIWLIVESCN